jgi:single-strand DNA-binding protein
MPSMNSVVLLGHLTRDPELRYTPQGAAVCEFTLALNRRYSRKDGEKVEEVAFVDVTVWNRLAEISAEYLKKGRAALVCGHLIQERWEDQATGQKRSKLRVVGQTVQFIGGGSKDDAPSEDVPASEEVPAEPAPAPAPAPAPVPPKSPAAKPPARPNKR